MGQETDDTKLTRWQRLKPLPIWVFLGITIVCLIVRENYPFTHNPMYANLPPRVRYYYVVDENGDNVPFSKAFGYSLIDLMRKIKDKRKLFAKEAGSKDDSEETVLKFEKQAVDPVMAWYFKNRRAKDEFKGKPIPYETLTVIKIFSTREGKTETEIGTVQVPEPNAG